MPTHGCHVPIYLQERSMSFTLDIDMLVPHGPNDAHPSDPRAFGRTSSLTQKRSYKGGFPVDPSPALLQTFNNILPTHEPSPATEEATFRPIWSVRPASRSIVPDISLRGTKGAPVYWSFPPMTSYDWAAVRLRSPLLGVSALAREATEIDAACESTREGMRIRFNTGCETRVTVSQKDGLSIESLRKAAVLFWLLEPTLLMVCAPYRMRSGVGCGSVQRRSHLTRKQLLYPRGGWPDNLLYFGQFRDPEFKQRVATLLGKMSKKKGAEGDIPEQQFRPMMALVAASTVEHLDSLLRHRGTDETLGLAVQVRDGKAALEVRLLEATLDPAELKAFARICVSLVQKAVFLRDDTIRSMVSYLCQRTGRGKVYPWDECLADVGVDKADIELFRRKRKQYFPFPGPWQKDAVNVPRPWAVGPSSAESFLPKLADDPHRLSLTVDEPGRPGLAS